MPRVALFRGLSVVCHAVEIKSEKVGIRANTEYQPFHFTDWHSFLVNGNLRSGVLLPFLDWGWAIVSIVFCGNIYFFGDSHIRRYNAYILGINVCGFRKLNKL